MIAPQDAAAFGRDALKASPVSSDCNTKVLSMTRLRLSVRAHGKQQNHRQRHTKHPQ
jgi:hypothetical protein